MQLLLSIQRIVGAAIQSLVGVGASARGAIASVGIFFRSLGGRK
jgi:hypothetical protein